MSYRDNYLRAVRFERPQRIPMVFHINPACWQHYDHAALQDLMEAHPYLFPDFKRQSVVRPTFALTQLKDKPYRDPWGGVWHTTEDGITGAVHEHPLEDWDAFKDYQPPSAAETDGCYPIDWEVIKRTVASQKANGELVVGGLPHGHTFLKIQDIRGYENVVFDMTDGEPLLDELLEMVSDFNYDFVCRWLELQPDVMTYPEDLGMQVGPMISPDLFRKYIKPVYQRIMKPSRDQDCIVHMHSDGDLHTLVDDLVDGGVEVINLQDRVNGIDWIASKFAGKTCVDLDIDRQIITHSGNPQQIDQLIRESVEKIGRKEGGLMMIYGLYPGVPLENAEAVMAAMEKYSLHFS